MIIEQMAALGAHDNWPAAIWPGSPGSLLAAESR